MSSMLPTIERQLSSAAVDVEALAHVLFVDTKASAFSGKPRYSRRRGLKDIGRRRDVNIVRLVQLRGQHWATARCLTGWLLYDTIVDQTGEQGRVCDGDGESSSKIGPGYGNPSTSLACCRFQPR